MARFGALVGQVIAPRAEVTDKHGPVLRRYDRWGEEVDEVVHHPNWVQSKADLVRNGFVSLQALAGRPVPGVVTASVSYLVCQAETAIYCGLGMTSGAADIVERYAPAAARDDLLGRLRSLDPAEAWEGGMFLTERQGGSDVGANTTRAVQDGDEWLLSGEKHFCSNVDAEVFIVLARPEGAPAGSRGLATYIVPRLLPDGTANGFRIKRLKPKLGTVGVPTGEVSLDGARAWLAGGSGAVDAGAGATDAARDGRGINRMMEMVNGSRFGVALMGLGIHRRSFLEAAIYAARRSQFGNRIDSYPLVRETLVDMLVDLEAGNGRHLRVRGRGPGRARTPSRVAWCAASSFHWPRCAARAWLWGRRPTASRSSVATATWRTGPWPASFATPSATPSGRAPRTSCASTSGGPCAASRRTSPCWPGWSRRSRRARDTRFWPVRSTPSPPRWPTPGRRSPTSKEHPTTWPCSRAGGSRSCWPTRWKEPCSWRKRRGSLDRNGDARKAAVARRFVSRRLATPALRGITDPDRSVLDLFEPLVRYGSIDGVRPRRLRHR